MKIIFIIAALLMALNSAAKNAKREEQEIKAHFIYTLSQYISWPDYSSSNEFNFCIAGKISKVIEKLDFLIKQHDKYKGMQGKLIVGSDSYSHCQVLFIPDSNTGELSAISNRLSNYPVLIISESDQIQNGAHFNLIHVNNKIGFEVNATQLEQNELSASSKVLRLATRVIK